MAFPVDQVDIFPGQLVLLLLLLPQKVHGQKFLFQGALLEELRLHVEHGQAVKFRQKRRCVIHIRTDAACAVKERKREKFNVAAIDTIFGDRKLTPEQIKNFRFIPYGNGKEYIMSAGDLATESKVVVPVFECKAPYKSFLIDLDQQLLVNLIDDSKTLNRYPGIKVGSMTEATNEAGNWE